MTNPSPLFPKTTNDFVRLSRQLLRQWRGARAQRDMDEIIGAPSTTWHKWETGYKTLKWGDFVNLAAKLDFPLAITLEKILAFPLKAVADSRELFDALRIKFANMTIGEFAHFLEISTAKARRILLENQEADFYLVLQFLGTCTQQLPFFLDSLDPNWSPEEYSQWTQSVLKQKSLEGQFGWLSALEAQLTLKSYSDLAEHSNQWLADELRLSVDQIEIGLELLEKNQAVEIEKGKYVLRRGRVDMEDSKQESARLAKYWTARALQRFDTADGVPASGRGWTYRIFPISKDGQESIRQEILRFYGELHKIISEDQCKDKEHVQILMLHNFDLDEFKD